MAPRAERWLPAGSSLRVKEPLHKQHALCEERTCPPVGSSSMLVGPVTPKQGQRGLRRTEIPNGCLRLETIASGSSTVHHFPSLDPLRDQYSGPLQSLCQQELLSPETSSVAWDLFQDALIPRDLRKIEVTRLTHTHPPIVPPASSCMEFSWSCFMNSFIKGNGTFFCVCGCAGCPGGSAV